MKKKISIILGVLALILAVGLNVRHAMNDYGVKESKLHIEAMACTAGSCNICNGDEPGYTWLCEAICCHGLKYCSVESCVTGCCFVICDNIFAYCC